jgi:hypothetical protein
MQVPDPPGAIPMANRFGDIEHVPVVVETAGQLEVVA